MPHCHSHVHCLSLMVTLALALSQLLNICQLESASCLTDAVQVPPLIWCCVGLVLAAVCQSHLEKSCSHWTVSHCHCGRMLPVPSGMLSSLQSGISQRNVTTDECVSIGSAMAGTHSWVADCVLLYHCAKIITARIYALRCAYGNRCFFSHPTSALEALELRRAAATASGKQLRRKPGTRRVDGVKKRGHLAKSGRVGLLRRFAVQKFGLERLCEGQGVCESALILLALILLALLLLALLLLVL